MKTMTFRCMCSCFIVITSLFFVVLIDKALQVDFFAKAVAEETTKRVIEKRKLPIKPFIKLKRHRILLRQASFEKPKTLSISY